MARGASGHRPMPHVPLRVAEPRAGTPQRGDERGSSAGCSHVLFSGVLPHSRPQTVRALGGPSESEELSRRGPAVRVSPTSTCPWHQALPRAGTNLARCSVTETDVPRPRPALQPTSPHVFMAGRLLTKAPLVRPHLLSASLPRVAAQPASRRSRTGRLRRSWGGG